MTSTTQAETEALLPCPFCGAAAKSGYIRDGRRIHCTNGDCVAGGPARFHGPVGMASAEDRAIAAWNTRAALTPKPLSVAPEDEALIANHRTATFYLSKTTKDSPLALKVRLEGEVDAAEEALRRQIAELRAHNMALEADNASYERTFKEQKAALAACRDKTIEECALIATAQYAQHGTLFGTPRAYNYEHAGRQITNAIRALKDKDHKHGTP